MSTAVIGAPEFRARSGRKVQIRDNGTVTFDHANGYLSPETAMDAEEFFQAQRDIELGRWRWPVNPDYVVYPTSDGFQIVNERTGISEVRNGLYVHDMEGEAAKACLDALPPAPWREAKPGEVWVLTTADGRELAYAVMSVAESGVVFESHDWRYDLDNIQIKSGRRIWPEDAL